MGTVVVLLIGIATVYAIALIVVWLKDRSNQRARSVPVARSAIMRPTIVRTAPPGPPTILRGEAPPPQPARPLPVRKDDAAHPERPGQAVFDDVATQIVLARAAVLASEFAQKAECQKAIDDAFMCYGLAAVAVRADKIVETFSLLQRARLAAAYATANAPPLASQSRRRGQG